MENKVLSLEEQIDVLKRVKKILKQNYKEKDFIFICNITSNVITDVHEIWTYSSLLHKLIPSFTLENIATLAKKYKFKKPKLTMKGGGWWTHDGDDKDYENRRRCLNALIKELENELSIQQDLDSIFDFKKHSLRKYFITDEDIERGYKNNISNCPFDNYRNYVKSSFVYHIPVVDQNGMFINKYLKVTKNSELYNLITQNEEKSLPLTFTENVADSFINKL